MAFLVTIRSMSAASIAGCLVRTRITNASLLGARLARSDPLWMPTSVKKFFRALRKKPRLPRTTWMDPCHPGPLPSLGVQWPCLRVFRNLSIHVPGGLSFCPTATMQSLFLMYTATVFHFFSVESRQAWYLHVPITISCAPKPSLSRHRTALLS